MSHAWMPLYVADYLADTGHLSTVEHGAYMLLIMHQHRFGDLPEDDEKWRRVARMSSLDWAFSRDTIKALFVDQSNDGRTPAQRACGMHRRRGISRRVREAVKLRDGEKCVYCGTTKGPFHFDHRFPFSRGGKHTVSNLCVACERCNASKGAKTDAEFEAVLESAK